MHHECFEKCLKKNMTTNNSVDGTWVRRWRKTVVDGVEVWVIKSRCCGRGFLDRQKNFIQRHSSTASRLSHRMICTLFAIMPEAEMEIWDITAAFLQGLKFSELEEKAKELGIETNEVRTVYFRPPANVWRHLNCIKGSKIYVDLNWTALYVLLLLKPIWGLVDAPLLWQLALLHVLIKQCGGVSSYFDVNFVYLTNRQGLQLACRLHVDDMIIVGMLSYIRSRAALAL